MLERLFTSKTRVKVLEFLLFRESSTYLREISRELKISVSAVKREVENLELFGVIKKTRNKIELNRNCSILVDLRNIFLKTDYFVYPIKDKINNLDLDFAFIFGSFAKGEYSPESDIDLFVVGKVKQMKLLRLLKPVESKIERDINVVVWSLEELKRKKKSSFVKDIAKNRIIMIKGSENELRKIIGKR